MKSPCLTEWSSLVKELFNKAEPYLQARNDLLHTQVAHEFALTLLTSEGGDRGVVEPAIILHDIGWSAVGQEKICGAFGVKAEGRERAKQINRIHEIEGASLAREILGSLGYDERLTAKIVEIIERHDSGTTPDSIEEKIVMDADKLWRFSKAGFWREIERQKVDHVFFYERLVRRRKKWLITRTAMEISQKELVLRKTELDEYLQSVAS